MTLVSTGIAATNALLNKSTSHLMKKLTHLLKQTAKHSKLNNDPEKGYWGIPSSFFILTITIIVIKLFLIIFFN
ncbi:hypothetical protein A7K91_02340 [Paenibacillus oryzae]|uniref:Uncharacterized protein n=1 Tax=Paenibacillus oryzae TaxID=1844972 RepID=A0A1A5YA63_9BACL|nr:hypothetical protein A7K91_02340 [Paenibacillus oryzae]